MLQAARAIVVAAAALIAPFAGNWTPLEKWVEPSYMVHRQGVDDYHCESYWLFESDFDTDIGRWVYRQRRVSLQEYMATEIPPRSEYDEEP